MSMPSDNAVLALRIVTVAWAGLTLVHFTIWTLAVIIGSDLDRPWWLWFGVPPGIVIGALWWWVRRQDWAPEPLTCRRRRLPAELLRPGQSRPPERPRHYARARLARGRQPTSNGAGCRGACR